jgi:hypothetical protein
MRYSQKKPLGIVIKIRPEGNAIEALKFYTYVYKFENLNYYVFYLIVFTLLIVENFFFNL